MAFCEWHGVWYRIGLLLSGSFTLRLRCSESFKGFGSFSFFVESKRFNHHRYFGDGINSIVLCDSSYRARSACLLKNTGVMMAVGA